MHGLNLLGENTLKYLQVPFKLSQWFHFHPFLWDKEGGYPTILAPAERYSWYFNVGINALHYVFVQWRCIQAKLDPETSVFQKVFMSYVTAAYFSFLMTHFFYIRRSEEIVKFLRSYLNFLRQYSQASPGISTTGTGDGKPFLLSSTCATFMAFIQYCFLGNFLFMIVLSVLRPWSHELLSSILANPHNLSLAQRLFFGLLEAYIILSNLEVLTFWVSFLLLFTFTAVDLINLIKFDLQNRNWASTGIIPNSFFGLYRSLQRGAAELSRLLIPIFGVNHVVIVVIAVSCAYAAVRLDGILAIGLGFVGSNATMLLLITMNLLADLNRKSKETLHVLEWEVARINSLTRACYPQWLRKQIRCMRNLRIQPGVIFFYDKSIVLTTLQIIVQASINLMLLY